MPFVKVENASVLVRKDGRFRASDVFVYGGRLYAKDGTSFVRLHSDNSTSVDRLRWEELIWPTRLARTSIGHLCTADMPGAIMMECE